MIDNSVGSLACDTVPVQEVEPTSTFQDKILLRIIFKNQGTTCFLIHVCIQVKIDKAIDSEKKS